MTRTLDYYREHVKPQVQDQDLGLIFDSLLTKPLYTLNYSSMRSLLDKQASTKQSISPYAKKGYYECKIDKKMDVIAGSWSDKSKYAHHTYEGGLLEHSIETYNYAVKMWQGIARVLKRKLDPQLEQAGYTKAEISQWYKDMEDVIGLGAYFHDVGKCAMNYPSFHRQGCKLLKMHEQYGYWMLSTRWDDYDKCFHNQMSESRETYKWGMVTALEMACVAHSGYYLNEDGTVIENKQKMNSSIKSFFAPYIVALADKLSATSLQKSKDFCSDHEQRSGKTMFLDYKLEWEGILTDLFRETGRYTIVNLGKQEIPLTNKRKITPTRDRFAIKYDHNGSTIILDLFW